MSENRKLNISRRDFMRLSALAAGGAALAGGLPGLMLAHAQDTKELVMTVPGRDLEHSYFQAVVDAFNASMQTAGQSYHATLNVGPAPDNDYVVKVNLDAASGQLSDAVLINGPAFQDMIAAGYLADLTDLADQWSEWPNFASVVKDQLTVDGRLYGLSDASTFTLFYRKDLLDAAGISTAQPQTWDDFYAIADDILTKTGATPLGIPAARPWGGGSWGEGFQHVWLGFAESNQIFDPADGKWVVSSDGLLKAFQVYETLATNKWLPVEMLLSPNPWEPIKYQGFVNGTVMVATGGDWQWEFDWGPKGANPIDDIFNKVDRWLFPSAVGEPFPTTGIGHLLGVSSQSQDVAGAFELIKAAIAPETDCQALEVYFGGPSALSDFGDSCPFYNTGVNGKMAEAGATLEAGRHLKSGPGESKIADGIALATENIISLTQTGEQAMADFAAAMRDAIGEDAVKEI